MYLLDPNLPLVFEYTLRYVFPKQNYTLVYELRGYENAGTPQHDLNLSLG